MNPAESAASALSRARRLIDTPPNVNTPSRLPLAAKLFRRTVNRGLANHTEQVNLRLNALADALQEHESVLVSGADPVGDGVANLARTIADLMQRLAADESLVGEVRAKTAALRHEIGEIRADVTGRNDRSYARLAALESANAEIIAHLGALEESIRESQRTLATQTTDHIDELNGVTSAQIAAVQRSVGRLDGENVARPYMSDPDALRVTDLSGHPAMGYTADSLDSVADYADFEDLFRGSEDLILDRLKPYLPILEDHAPVLDVGCGRGELLQLLVDSGIEARGIDPDPSMVTRAKGHGLDVSQLDARTALSQSPPASLGAVVSIQVVEHISVGEMREFFAAAFAALRPGGVFIAETVNPHSPMALKAFWVDLTHVRPLYPESLLLLARESGFTSARIMFPVGNGDLDDDLRACGEYAIVAQKD